MCRIGIVANNESFASLLDEVLPEKTKCKILVMRETELVPGPTGGSPPDLLIVDLAATIQSVRCLFANLGNSFPEVAIIVIVPAETLHAAETLAPFGVDEIIICPAEGGQMGGMLEKILQRIAVVERLLATQEKLQHEMRQGQIVAKSKPMRKIVQHLPQLAACASTVLITGETGTGKE